MNTAETLLSPEGIEERAEYYAKWAVDIRAMNGASVDADHSEQTAFVLRALLANAQAPYPITQDTRYALADLLRSLHERRPEAIEAAGEVIDFFRSHVLQQDSGAKE